MAYATFADVEARAGRYASVFSVTGKQPDETTVGALLADVSAELDGAIKARGHDVPVSDETAVASLKDVAAYGALARALASVPGDDGLEELRDYARDVWAAALKAIADGSFVAIGVLEASGAGSSAGDLWSEEPGYDPVADRDGIQEAAQDSLAPAFTKGQTL